MRKIDFDFVRGRETFLIFVFFLLLADRIRRGIRILDLFNCKIFRKYQWIWFGTIGPESVENAFTHGIQKSQVAVIREILATSATCAYLVLVLVLTIIGSSVSDSELIR